MTFVQNVIRDFRAERAEHYVTSNCEDLDLSQHLHDALNSLKIVLAAEESLKTGRTLEL